MPNIPQSKCPFFTKHHDGTPGQGRQQTSICTAYKEQEQGRFHTVRTGGHRLALESHPGLHTGANARKIS